jgi:hypothetical protein
MSDEARARLSAAAVGRKQSPELVAKRTEAMRRFYAAGGKSGMFGKTASEETRAKRSASMKATLARNREAVVNHVVVSVEQAGTEDVYDMTVPGAECFVANGVVVHNSLGFAHEHMRREVVARLDRQKTIRYFAQTQGWSARDVEQQVLTPIEERALFKPTATDQDSIMCYQLPGSITIDGQPIPGGDALTESDLAYADLIYPRADSPTPPPVQPPVDPVAPVAPPVAPPVDPPPAPEGELFGKGKVLKLGSGTVERFPAGTYLIRVKKAPAKGGVAYVNVSATPR